MGAVEGGELEVVGVFFVEVAGVADVDCGGIAGGVVVGAAAGDGGGGDGGGGLLVEEGFVVVGEFHVDARAGD